MMRKQPFVQPSHREFIGTQISATATRAQDIRQPLAPRIDGFAFIAGLVLLMAAQGGFHHVLHHWMRQSDVAIVAADGTPVVERG